MLLRSTTFLFGVYSKYLSLGREFITKCYIYKI